MKNNKRIFLGLIALLLASAFAFAACSSCNIKELITGSSGTNGTPEPEPTPEPTPVPSGEGLIGEWKCKLDIAPIMIDTIHDSIPFDLDLSNAQFKNTQVTMTVVFDEDGNYKTTVAENEVKTVISGLIENNWDTLKQIIINFAAEEYGKAPEEITDDDIFGAGKIVPLASWDQLKSTAGMMLPTLLNAKTIAGMLTKEGTYTMENGKLTLEGFDPYNEFSCTLTDTTLILNPAEATEGEPAGWPYPLVFEKTKN